MCKTNAPDAETIRAAYDAAKLHRPSTVCCGQCRAEVGGCLKNVVFTVSAEHGPLRKKIQAGASFDNPRGTRPAVIVDSMWWTLPPDDK